MCVCITMEWRWGMWVWHNGGREAVEGEGRGGGSNSVHEQIRRVRCMLQGQVLGLIHMFDASCDDHYHRQMSQVPLLSHAAFGRMAIVSNSSQFNDCGQILIIYERFVVLQTLQKYSLSFQSSIPSLLFSS